MCLNCVRSSELRRLITLTRVAYSPIWLNTTYTLANAQKPSRLTSMCVQLFQSKAVFISRTWSQSSKRVLLQYIFGLSLLLAQSFHVGDADLVLCH